MELSREKRRESEIRRVVEQINSIRKKPLDLPAFLFPTSGSDLEEKYVWLNDLEKMPKITEVGEIGTTIINISSQPKVKGFMLSITQRRNLTTYFIALVWVLTGIAFYVREPWWFDVLRSGEIEIIAPITYIAIAFILSIIIFLLKGILVIQSLKITTIPSHNAVFFGRTLLFQTMSEELSLKPLDIQCQRMYNRNVYLIDQQYLGIGSARAAEVITTMLKSNSGMLTGGCEGTISLR